MFLAKNVATKTTFSLRLFTLLGQSNFPAAGDAQKRAVYGRRIGIKLPLEY